MKKTKFIWLAAIAMLASCTSNISSGNSTTGPNSNTPSIDSSISGPTSASDSTNPSAPTSDSASSEGPTSTTTSEGPSSTSTSEGPTSTTTSEGPTSTSTSEGPTSTTTSEGPTSTTTSEGPTSTSTSEGPTSTSTSEGPVSDSTSTSVSVPLREISELELNSLQGRVHLSGLENMKGSTSVERSIEVVFEQGKFYYKENSPYTGVLLYSFEKTDTGFVYKSLDKNNEEISIEVDPDENEWDYDNPFDILTTSNFTAIGENKFALDVTLAEDVVTTITDYHQYVNSFVVTTDGSKVVSMSVETRNKSVDTEVFEYAYIVSEHGTAQIPSLSYKDDGHASELQQALDNMGDNFTITAVNHLDKYDDVTTVAYYEDGMMFNSNEEVNSGIVINWFTPFAFTVENDVAKIGNPIQGDLDYMIDFSFAPEFFKKDITTSKFVPQDNYVPQYIGGCFGYDDRTTMEFGGYATDIQIALNGDVIEEIIVTTNVYNTIMTTTMTFSNIGSTEMPFDTTAMLNGQFTGWSADQYSVINGYMGGDSYIPYYPLEEISTSVSGTPEQLVVTGSTYDETVLDKYGALLVDEGYVAGTKNEGYYDTTQTFTSDDFTIELVSSTWEDTILSIKVTSATKAPVVVPEKFLGTYEAYDMHGGTFKGADELIIVITAEHVLFNSTTLIIDSIGPNEDFALLDGDDIYYLMPKVQGADTVDEIFVFDDDHNSTPNAGIFTADLYRVAGGTTPTVEIPQRFVGTYSGQAILGTFNDSEEIEVTITETSFVANGLTATVNGINDFGELELTINGVEYYASVESDTGILVFGTVSDYSFLARLNPTGDSDPSVAIPSAYIGTYSGTATTGTFEGASEITLVVTATTFTLNGVEATIKSADEFNDMEVTINGTDYYVSIDQDSNVTIMSSDYSFVVNLAPQAQEEPALEIPSELHGIYKGTTSKGTFASETEITIVISAYSISVNGEVGIIVSYNEVYGIDFTIDGVAYYFAPTAQNDEFVFAAGDESVVATMTAYVESETPAQIDIPVFFQGTFTGTYVGTNNLFDSNEAIIVVTEHTITINGNSVTPVEVTNEYQVDYLYFEIGGNAYYLSHYSYGDVDYYSMSGVEDTSVYINTLTKTN